MKSYISQHKHERHTNSCQHAKDDGDETQVGNGPQRHLKTIVLGLSLLFGAFANDLLKTYQRWLKLVYVMQFEELYYN